MLVKYYTNKKILKHLSTVRLDSKAVKTTQKHTKYIHSIVLSYRSECFKCPISFSIPTNSEWLPLCSVFFLWCTLQFCWQKTQIQGHIFAQFIALWYMHFVIKLWNSQPIIKPVNKLITYHKNTSIVVSSYSKQNMW